MHKFLIENGVSCSCESYKSLVEYKYLDEDISEFADYMFTKRYSSKTLELGMQLDKLKDLTCQLDKGYTEWNGVEDLKEIVNSKCRDLGDAISSFWDYAIHNMKKMDEIKRRYEQLEEYASQYRIKSCIKRFIIQNSNNNELMYLI